MRGRDRGDDTRASLRPGRQRERTPVQRALALLTRREHSRRELVGKLVARGVGEDEAQAAVERLAGAGWQNDARFADSLLRSRAGAGYGPAWVRAELERHGVDRDLISATLASFDGDWGGNARDLVRRRFGAISVQSDAIRRKAAELLYRRGFSAEQVRRATDPDHDAL